MCGIAGAITKFPINEEKLLNTKKVLGFRGPDNSGESVRQSDNGIFITLIHTRLSILDLDKRANQPMKYNNIDLVFNGEIYNFLEIKEVLSREFDFLTNCDTEVILKLLHKKGIKSLKECEGMFALGYFDLCKNKLFLARDRFGEKPIFYYKDSDGSFYFGSEPKAIFALLGSKLSVDLEHCRRFLINGYKSLYKNKYSFFKNLNEVSPGYCLEIDTSGKLLTYPWKSVDKFSQKHDMSYQEAVKGTKEKLISSMEKRLRADVPIAFCLSGGIDSNALIGIAKNLFNYDVHGFTIMNRDERYEEKDMVDYAVKTQNLKHTGIPVNKNNFLENLSKIIRYHDSPISTISYYAHWLLMEAISKRGYKVSVSGTGADEIFSGYYDHHLAYLSEISSENIKFFEQSKSNWEKNIKPFVRNPYLQNFDYLIKNPCSRSHIFLNSNEYSKYLTYPFHENFEEKIYTPYLLRNRMANELFHESVPVILHEDDLNSMFFSIENRSPYLDGELFEWSQKVPTKHLIRNSFTKSILRDSIRDFVPNKIIDNPRKVGFNVPIDDYIDFQDEDVMNELSKSSPIEEIIRVDLINNLLKNSKRSNEESKFIFNYLSTRYFLEAFN